MNILGIFCYYHDSAAALFQDRKIVAAAQEERFTRRKHDSSFPSQAIAFCLTQKDIEVSDLSWLFFTINPCLILIAFSKLTWPKPHSEFGHF